MWAAAFVASAVVSLYGWLTPINLFMAHLLEPLGKAVPDFSIIWVIGSVPVVGVLLLLWDWSMGRWRQFWIFLGGVVLEIVTKHLIGTPLPHSVGGEPFWIGRLERWVNPSPHVVFTAIKRKLGILPSVAQGTQSFFRGSFFSGHVFRLTFLTGVVGGAGRPWLMGIIGLIAGILVVALGGHWALDAIGGFCLARALISADSYFRRKR